MAGKLVEQAWVAVDACTLPTPQQPLRLAEFDALFRDAVRGVDRVSPTRLRLVLDTGAEARARELAARESECCSFFTFEFTAAVAGVVHLVVGVPAARVAVLDGLAARANAGRSV
ncbi:hypothetical protein IU421_24825 [Nocardia cyriacigeorgica]|nr:hypothetical protein [Nocardia cyriacigeorgica]MBF6093185.1 hypothetical protein [Nocardia cyriacigeorgica]MBF6326650.1 hypothetical protein [Nocardia cyriacigeorgica]MBF6347320.1 hypothetical protein [Nocardia cyriacigeorgica]MBF6517481.1 hypothetical protein [Nocardia cyriacigeorgica]